MRKIAAKISVATGEALPLTSQLELMNEVPAPRARIQGRCMKSQTKAGSVLQIPRYSRYKLLKLNITRKGYRLCSAFTKIKKIWDKFTRLVANAFIP